ncbi:Ff.00g098410.m01.CDS01 [Fusarium sp. VM40]|nr:Ff.00g098410.m01.CDS01 [Fusarium sp. VM40]
MPPVISGRVVKPGAKAAASQSKAKSKPKPRTKEEHVERRKAKAAEDRREWETQYLQGKPAEYFAGYDREIVSSTLPPIHVISPFEGYGRIRTTAEKDEPGWDFFRFTRGVQSDPDYYLFVVPHQHIERIIVIPEGKVNPSKYTVVIVPTAATGSSAVTKKYPKIIRFEMLDTVIRTTELPKDSKGYPTFKDHLQNPEEQQVIFKAQVHDQSQPMMFKCLANLDKVEDSYVERSEGSLYFLPKGILWLGESTLYFPVSSINMAMLLFSKESTRGVGAPGYQTVAMGFMIKAKEPYYEGEEPPRPPFLYFKDIQNYSVMRQCIERYCEAHSMGMRLTEQLFYSYKNNSPMTGWSNLKEDE